MSAFIHLHTPICPSILLSVHPFVSIHPSIHLSICLSICRPIHQPAHPVCCLSTYPSIYLDKYICDRFLICLPVTRLVFTLHNFNCHLQTTRHQHQVFIDFVLCLPTVIRHHTHFYCLLCDEVCLFSVHQLLLIFYLLLCSDHSVVPSSVKLWPLFVILITEAKVIQCLAQLYCHLCSCICLSLLLAPYISWFRYQFKTQNACISYSIRKFLCWCKCVKIGLYFSWFPLIFVVAVF